MTGDFHCPMCGSEFFGTSGGRGFCKGHQRPGYLREYTGCDFTWPRSVEEDTKVGLAPFGGGDPVSAVIKIGNGK